MKNYNTDLHIFLEMLGRKRPRIENDNVFKRAGKILYQVSHFKEFSQGPAGQTKFSGAVCINGLNWRVKIEHNEDKVGIYLHCDDDENDDTWACRAAAQFTIVPFSSGSGNDICLKKMGELDDFDIYRAGSESSGGFREFARFADLMDESVYNVETDTVTFKAELIVGARKEMPGVSTEDALLVNNESVYVNKHVLAAYSKFFRPLFFGDNAEDVPRVQIDGPDAVAQFERLVTATHDQRRVELNDECVEDILLLANRFQFDSVVSDCFEFLVHSSNKSNIGKFRLADQCENIIVKKKILNAMTKDDFAWKNYFKNRSEEDKLGSGALTELKERHNELQALDEGGV